jgi:hypothetical protein
MKKRNLVSTILAGALFTLASFGPASAGALFTPIIFIGGNDQLLCIANNVSPNTITVRVTIIGFFASSPVEVCTLAPGDKFGCQQFLNDQSGHCRIVSSISTPDLRAGVRGVMFSRITTAPFTVDAIVQAE